MSVYFDVALAKRKCSMCGNTIEKDEKCVGFTGGSGRYMTKNNMCKYCVIEFIMEYYGNPVLFNRLKKDYLTNKVINSI